MYVKFVDTTMRDGEQTPGVHFVTQQKLDIARRLAKTGIDVIEVGFPAASEGDFDAVSSVARAAAPGGELENVTISALSRLNEKDIDAAVKALAPAAKSRIHIFIATSDIHLEHKLHMTREQVLDAVRKFTTMVKESGAFGEIEFSAEDATRTDPEYLKTVLMTAAECGADVVNIPDTVGYTTPREYSRIISGIRAILPERVEISVHCHNDLGMATANSLSAIQSGAVQIECTVNGLGERAGNAPMEEIVMALRVRRDVIKGTDGNSLDFGIHTEEITETSRLVASISGINVAPNKAVVGDNAFSHASGIHQHGVMEASGTYEIMKPEEIGLTSNTIVLGKLSGRHAFAERVVKLGYNLTTEGIDRTFSRFKEIAEKKPTITNDDVRAIVGEYLDSIQGRYKISTFQIQSGNHTKAMALVSLRDNDSPEHDVITDAAPGEGPIDASFNAVNRIAGATGVELISYGIDAITEGADALGEAKLTIKVGSDAIYTGRGVSSDIIKASLKAYVNAINKWISACGNNSSADEDKAE